MHLVVSACPRGGEVLFAVKTMFLPYKDISAAYINTGRLCGCCPQAESLISAQPGASAAAPRVGR